MSDVLGEVVPVAKDKERKRQVLWLKCLSITIFLFFSSVVPSSFYKVKPTQWAEIRMWMWWQHLSKAEQQSYQWWWVEAACPPWAWSVWRRSGVWCSPSADFPRNKESGCGPSEHRGKELTRVATQVECNAHWLLHVQFKLASKHSRKPTSSNHSLSTLLL